MFKKSVFVVLVFTMLFSSGFSSFAIKDGNGHGYHYIRATSSSYQQVYGHAQLPEWYAGSTSLETYPEVFYGIYRNGVGLDIGLVYRPSSGWCPFANVHKPARNSNDKSGWVESPAISGLNPTDTIYMETKVEKRGSSYYVVLYCKENGSYNNKTKVLEYKLDSSWGRNVHTYGGIINREVSLASNYTEYLTSGAYLYNAKWIDGGLVKPNGYTYAWGSSQTGNKGMHNDDGAALSKYYNVDTGSSNGYVTETVSIDYRGGL